MKERKRKPSLELGRCNPRVGCSGGWRFKELLWLRLLQMPMHYIRHKDRKRVKEGEGSGMNGKRFVQFYHIIQFVTGMEIVVLVFQKLSTISMEYAVLTGTDAFSIVRCPCVCCMSGVSALRNLNGCYY